MQEYYIYLMVSQSWKSHVICGKLVKKFDKSGISSKHFLTMAYQINNSDTRLDWDPGT